MHLLHCISHALIKARTLEGYLKKEDFTPILQYLRTKVRYCFVSSEQTKSFQQDAVTISSNEIVLNVWGEHYNDADVFFQNALTFQQFRRESDSTWTNNVWTIHLEYHDWGLEKKA